MKTALEVDEKEARRDLRAVECGYLNGWTQADEDAAGALTAARRPFSAAHGFVSGSRRALRPHQYETKTERGRWHTANQRRCESRRWHRRRLTASAIDQPSARCPRRWAGCHGDDVAVATTELPARLPCFLT